MQDGAITITNGPATLTMRPDPASGIDVSIERDHPVPFVRVETRQKHRQFALTLTCELQT